MRWTTWAALGAMVTTLSGCVYGYRSVILQSRYSTASRPDPSYHCYDCHGYRFFDPYYDWCASYGFRYRWANHPGVMRLYRERYVRIKETHPEYGRYRYKRGYRNSSRYVEARDYESWRAARSEKAGPDDRGVRQRDRSREQAPRPQGKKHQDKRERKGSRDREGREPSHERR
jgi:hypothetical protein